MGNKIQFINKELISPIIIIGVLLLILFIWKEWKSTKENKFIISVITSIVAVTSLMLIALKPSIETESKKLTMIVLTDNYKQESLDSLQKINKNITVKNYQKGKNILDKNTKSTQVFILGNGIESYDLWQLKNTTTKYIEGKPIEGITRLKYNSKLFVGEFLSVEGLYHFPKKGNKLLLEFPKGTKLDSIVFDKSEKQQFQLKSRVKVDGKFLYSLVERDSLNREVESNPLPIVVKEKENLSVLMLNSFPTFDTKYLKNFLAESGHKVIVRNKFTKGKYKYEYFNTKKERVSISTKSLKDFDILIIDATSFLNLSLKQRNIVKNTIEKEGLGVFIQPNINFFTSKNGLTGFRFLRNKSNSFKLKGIKKSIPKYNYLFKENKLVQPIHKKEKKIYSGFKFIGKGKIASTVGRQTYQLVLSGNASSFKQFWTEIINTISKKQLKKARFNTSSFAYKDEPFSFQLQTNVDEPKIEDIKGNNISIIQSINKTDSWTGRIHPKVSGWNQISIEKDSLTTFSFYTLNQEKYKSLKAFETSINNKRYFNYIENDSFNFYHKKLINPFWFYFLLLLSIGYLWLVPKL